MKILIIRKTQRLSGKTSTMLFQVITELWLLMDAYFRVYTIFVTRLRKLFI